MCKTNLHFKKELKGLTINVDVTVPNQGVTVLFGASGSGKTSILNCIAGIYDSHGVISIQGEFWQNTAEKIFLKTHKRSMGYVFQDSMLFATMTVEQNLTYACENKSGASLIQLQDLVAQFNISDLMSKKSINLSGGEKQKVAIIRAMLGTPKVLLLDEPLASLDNKSKKEILNILFELKTKIKIPFIYVTHSVDEVLRLADNIGFMEHGILSKVIPIEKAMDRLCSFDLGEKAIAVRGFVKSYDQEFYLATVEVEGVDFLIPGTMETNSFINFKIMANNISLTKVKDTNSSILNIFKVEIINHEIIREQVYIDLIIVETQIKLIAKITKKSFSNLNLAKGQQVFAQVKAINLV
ncbi:MAG: molybdenum ABC transporter ATP-binding protein [Halobacteriovoraceae bacterium]|jgi:molybdate transport system ATP-binding protein|nr:molybdenum ABC transporter ATP-binding protein [Halobacteriovoraceae bacterium]